MSEYIEPETNESPTRSEIAQRSGAATQKRIRALMLEQPYGVLCTQGAGHPYGSIIAFAVNSALNAAVFATPMKTRKFRLLTECSQVALVVDNRATTRGDLSRTHAVTATGSALNLQGGDAEQQWRDRLIDRHPLMRAFISAPDTALIRIDILEYLHVARLEAVSRWVPPRY